MPTENDRAWERYITTKGLQLDGTVYEIQARELEEIAHRQPRLLTKIDTPEQLPRIFRENGYAIISITNGSYCLFKGNLFASVASCSATSDFSGIETAFPLESTGRGRGEFDYLDNAFNTGILSHFTQNEKLYLTIRGRERTKPFDFTIGNLSVQVNGVQIESDAGYEGERDIILVEAKIGARSHFNIRQLYYPFRHFSLLVPNKRIRSLLFEYDVQKATYTFHEFAFSNPLVFDSIYELRCCAYILTPPTVRRIDELIDVRFETTSQVVPQANDLNKVLEMLTLINQGQNTATDIADYFVFDPRQSYYYGEAAEYLGLITRYRGVFELTEHGFGFISAPFKEQQIYVAKLIVNSWIFRELIQCARQKGYFTDDDIELVIAKAQSRNEKPRYTSTTIPRRRQTIVAWCMWLAEQIGCLQIEGRHYRLA